MMLTSETLGEIAALVRSGFYNRERLIEVFTDEMYAPGELDTDCVISAIDSQFAAYEQEKHEYPAVTDCDRLDTAFAMITGRGIIALQNAGYTQSDGYDDVCDIYARQQDKSAIQGYCFYHGQDLEGAMAGGGLYLAFGPIDAAEEQTVGVAVGQVIREELEKAGFVVRWDGTFDKRLCIPNFIWQKH